MPPAPPEHRFLLAVFRAACGTVEAADLEPPPDLAWPRFTAAAAVHGLIPQAASALAPLAAAGRVPETVAEGLRRGQRRVARRHLTALATLRDAGRALAPAGVPYAVLKGPALSLALHGQRALRAYADVDLLVRRADREQAIARLAAAGYPPAAGRFSRRLLRRVHFHLVLEPARGRPAPRTRLKIELHWSLLDRANLFRIDGEALFGRLRAVAAGEATVPALGLEDELLYLALHAARHGVGNRLGLDAGEPAEWFLGPATGTRLRWFLDLHAWLERFGAAVDWSAARRRAERWNVAREVAETLSLLERLAPGGLAAGALDKLGLEAAGASAGQAGPLAALLRSGHGQRLLARSLNAHPSLVIRPARLLFIRRLLVPSPAEIRRYYGPACWLPWLYLRHPFHLARKVLK